ncbi:hypothetical protein TSAR_005099 [Trichomalopsis sarcophagae]|uniref:Uncharacterized protein n=1 Tax=Trichomalopsis sarcophagae TaxID=543379 RepID=A0A232FM99_9HYME|nr:hypothetical protein TSAR_005099 [Trichomalopsis sarcophagae]
MSRANQRAPMRSSLSARTGSQSVASKKRGPDEHERRVSARTSGEIREFSPDYRRSTSTFCESYVRPPLLVEVDD